MSIIQLNKKYPERQAQSSLRLAVRNMQTSLDKQRDNIEEFQTAVSQLRGVMVDMKQNFQLLNQNLGNIKVAKLGQKSRQLDQVMGSLTP